MTTKLTLQEAQDQLARDPAWRAESGVLAGFMIHISTGEKITCAQHQARFYDAEGRFHPENATAWMNAATAVYRQRLEQLMAGSAPLSSPPAPTKTEPAAPTRAGASVSTMSSAAALALASVAHADREPAPQPQQADAASAGWDRAIQGIAERTPGAKVMADGHDGKPADYFRLNHDAAPAVNVETKYQEPPTAVLSAGWDRAVASASPTVPTTEPTTRGQAASEGEKIQAGWDAAVRAQAGTVAEGYHGSTPKQ